MPAQKRSKIQDLRPTGEKATRLTWFHFGIGPTLRVELETFQRGAPTKCWRETAGPSHRLSVKRWLGGGREAGLLVYQGKAREVRMGWVMEKVGLLSVVFEIYQVVAGQHLENHREHLLESFSNAFAISIYLQASLIRGKHDQLKTILQTLDIKLVSPLSSDSKLPEPPSSHLSTFRNTFSRGFILRQPDTSHSRLKLRSPDLLRLCGLYSLFCRAEVRGRVNNRLSECVKERHGRYFDSMMQRSIQSGRRHDQYDDLVLSKLRKVSSCSSISTKLFGFKFVQLVMRVKDSQVVKQLNHVSSHVFNNSSSDFISDTGSVESFRKLGFNCIVTRVFSLGPVEVGIAFAVDHADVEFESYSCGSRGKCNHTVDQGTHGIREALEGRCSTIRPGGTKEEILLREAESESTELSKSEHSSQLEIFLHERVHKWHSQDMRTCQRWSRRLCTQHWRLKESLKYLSNQAAAERARQRYAIFTVQSDKGMVVRDNEGCIASHIFSFKRSLAVGTRVVGREIKKQTSDILASLIYLSQVETGCFDWSICVSERGGANCVPTNTASA
ncbi:hypothetical protein KCU91_g138, partial [Aureobasidium melanogenum]